MCLEPFSSKLSRVCSCQCDGHVIAAPTNLARVRACRVRHYPCKCHALARRSLVEITSGLRGKHASYVVASVGVWRRVGAGFRNAVRIVLCFRGPACALSCRCPFVSFLRRASPGVQFSYVGPFFSHPPCNLSISIALASQRRNSARQIKPSKEQDDSSSVGTGAKQVSRT